MGPQGPKGDKGEIGPHGLSGEKANEWIQILVNVILIGITFWGVSISQESFKNTSETNYKINRPYIEIDSSEIAEQLVPTLDWNSLPLRPDSEILYTNGQYDPSKAEEARRIRSLPIEFNISFSFTITNVGQLPAKYSIDRNQFNLPGLITILPPPNETGIIFPNQKIILKYDVKGEQKTQKYFDESEKQAKWISKLFNSTSTSLVASSTDDYISKISIKYGLLDDTELNLQTTIQEVVYEKNCSTIPTPARCVPNPEWVTVMSN